MNQLLLQQLKYVGLEAKSLTEHSKAMQQLLTLISESYDGNACSQILSNNPLYLTPEQINQLYHQLHQEAYSLEEMIAVTPDLIFIVDREGKYIHVFSQGKEHMLYTPKEQIIGHYISDIFDPLMAEQFEQIIQRVLTSKQLQSIEYTLPIQNEPHYFEMRAMPTGVKVDGVTTVIAIVREITEQKKQEHISRLIATVFEEATEGMMIKNSNRTVIKINPAMLRILEVKEEEILGKRLDYLSKMILPEIKEQITQALHRDNHWQGEVQLQRKDKSTLLVWLSIDTLQDSSGALNNTVFILTDISKIQKQRDKMKHLATHDSLTKLPNRSLLYDRLEHSIASMQRNGQKGAVIFLDLDHFKDINDTYGHHVGDLVLQEFSHRLQHLIRASDTLGRLGGDEFLLIAENIKDRQHAQMIIKKLLTHLKEPFCIEQWEIESSVSIGAALFPHDGETTEALIHAADQAMYAVKKQGRNGFEFYSHKLSYFSNEYFSIRGAIKRALKEDNFEVLYQPQFSLYDGSLTGMEVLLRCHDSMVADIPISRLISIAEESGLIGGISQLVLKKSCAQIKAWHKLTLDPIKVAVNLSRKELSSPTLVETIKENLATCCIGPLILEFEITETILMKSSFTAQQNIKALREIGCLFSIDDFGTGFSSLSNLKEFDLDKLKIDQSFIRDLHESSDDRIIVSATIKMAQQLGLTVLAEGVETLQQKEILEQFGCDEVQGFLYSKPLTGAEMTQLLQSQKS